MKRMNSILSASLVAAAVFSATPVHAQTADFDPAEVAAATRYALPSAFQGFLQRCSATLGRNGYARNNAKRLEAKFSDGSQASWPGAKALLLQMAKKEAGDASAVFGLLDDDSLQPFVDGIVTNLVSQEIKLDQCETIERGLEILDPLPADNVAEMVGFLIELGVADRQGESQ